MGIIDEGITNTDSLESHLLNGHLHADGNDLWIVSGIPDWDLSIERRNDEVLKNVRKKLQKEPKMTVHKAIKE